MTPLIVLEIIKLSLEITLEILRSAPQDVKAQLLRDHLQTMEFWRSVFGRLDLKVQHEALKGLARSNQSVSSGGFQYNPDFPSS